MKFVDVILPLPLDGLFTYSVPEGMEKDISFGKRVLVQFGRSKKYIAIIVTIHDIKPEFKCRDIDEILDKQPVILEKQYQVWRWISFYYMSSLGDVYNASFPSGMKDTEKFKPKLETYISLSENYRSEQSLHIAFD
nr:primosomal protein N' [Prevotella sp.]